MTLVSPTELRQRIVVGEPIVLCDVRLDLSDHANASRSFRAGHLPDAVFVDLHSDLAGGSGGGRHPLPDVGDFAQLLGRLGIRPDSNVVAYDDAGGYFASRLWWMLRSIGHMSVEVLDGGLAAWTECGYPVTNVETERTPTTYPEPLHWTGIVDANSVASVLASGGSVIDARAQDRYRGDHEPIDARAGHVPGARNLFHGSSLRDDGTHRSVAELTDRFRDVPSAPIVYCGSGVTACHLLLALSVAGVEGAQLYPGSWSEWASDPSRPIATGSQP